MGPTPFDRPSGIRGLDPVAPPSAPPSNHGRSPRGSIVLWGPRPRDRLRMEANPPDARALDPRALDTSGSCTFGPECERPPPGCPSGPPIPCPCRTGASWGSLHPWRHRLGFNLNPIPPGVKPATWIGDLPPGDRSQSGYGRRFRRPDPSNRRPLPRGSSPCCSHRSLFGCRGRGPLNPPERFPRWDNGSRAARERAPPPPAAHGPGPRRRGVRTAPRRDRGPPPGP